jgi:hypothetical protein
VVVHAHASSSPGASQVASASTFWNTLRTPGGSCGRHFGAAADVGLAWGPQDRDDERGATPLARRRLLCRVNGRQTDDLGRDLVGLGSRRGK